MGTRYQQPQSGGQIDRSNPLTRGLIAAGVPGLFSTRPITSENGSRVVTKAGVGMQYVPYAWTQFYLPKDASEYTLIAIGTVTHEASERHLLNFDRYSNGWRGFQLRASYYNIEFIPFDAHGTPISLTVSTAPISPVAPALTIIARQKAALASLDTSIGSASSTALSTVKGISKDWPLTVGQHPEWPTTSEAILGYAVYDRYVSDIEVAALLKNPWQIFKGSPNIALRALQASSGSSSVTSDSAAYYLIRNAISQDISSVFGVRGLAQLNLAASYDLRGNAQKDVSASYFIRGLVQSDKATSYSLRGPVQSSESASYAIRGSVSADRSAAYGVLNASAVSSSLDVSYSVRGAVQSDESNAFSVFGAVQSNAAASYSVRASAQSSFSASYAIDAGVSSVSSDLQPSYFIDGVAAQYPTTSDIAAALLAALNATTGTRTIGQHLQIHTAVLAGETSGAGTPHIAFIDGSVTVEADVPVVGQTGDRKNVVIDGV